MWGNLYGWMIALALCVLMSVGLWQLHAAGQASAPTAFGTNPAALLPLSADMPTNTVVQMTSPGDAGDLYRKAIADLKVNAYLYDNARVDGNEAPATQLDGVKAVLAATPLAKATLLAAAAEQNIGYFDSAISPDLAAIEKVGTVVEQLGLIYYGNMANSEAKQYFAAEFALGAKLFDERVSYAEAEKGIGFMRAAVRMLMEIAKTEKNAARQAELAAFDAKLGESFDRIRAVWTIIYSVDQRVIARHAGDIFLFSTPAQQERMWRVESILKLGRFKYNVGGADARVANHTRAAERLAELEKTETDPVIRAAVKAAQGLTLEQFRRIQ
ncbi:MAG: hypothetical protein H7144_02355 [Burkholderiales bacterium]|nr:hypothetical protein [Phycisphaerae bacterium]